MRITHLSLNNYRQFRNVNISFDKHTANDIHVIIGRNGSGKTNILNAINWCLYGEEPHLSKDSRQLPRLSLKALSETENEDEDRKKVHVAIAIQGEGDASWVMFEREEEYAVYKEGEKPRLMNTIFKVLASDERGNVKMIDEHEASSYVERFVPYGIKEFFFFDGERLDSYFRGATGQQISHAIFRISQVSILEDVEDKLQKVINDLTKDASKQYPSIEETKKELDWKNDDLKEIQRQMSECAKQITVAKEEADERRRNLSGIPDVEHLQKERDRLREQYTVKETAWKEKEREKANLLFEYGTLIPVYPTIIESLQIIKGKRERKEIPPTGDKALLESILTSEKCICGTDVIPGSEEEKRVSRLLEDIKLSSDIGQALTFMENPLESFVTTLSEFKTNMQKITNEIKGHKEDGEDIDRRKREIDAQIVGYDVDKIRQWHEELQAYEKTHSENLQTQGILKKEKENLEKRIEELKQKLDSELQKVDKLKKVKKSIDFGAKASNIARGAIEAIMDDIRRKIRDETEKTFFELIWKKETFKEVVIDTGYDIHLIHRLGYECLGTVSAAERELLALAFILALHKSSGFDSPILIDTPVARVSDEQRENFAKVFLDINPNKQIILLFTPAEYSYEVSKTLDDNASTRCNLVLSLDEQEARVEAL